MNCGLVVMHGRSLICVSKFNSSKPRNRWMTRALDILDNLRHKSENHHTCMADFRIVIEPVEDIIYEQGLWSPYSTWMWKSFQPCFENANSWHMWMLVLPLDCVDTFVKSSVLQTSRTLAKLLCTVLSGCFVWWNPVIATCYVIVLDLSQFLVLKVCSQGLATTQRDTHRELCKFCKLP